MIRTDPIDSVLVDGQYVYGAGKILYADQSDEKLYLGADAKFPIGISAGEGERAGGGVPCLFGDWSAGRAQDW